jgi:primary-amine oxidase
MRRSGPTSRPSRPALDLQPNDPNVKDMPMISRRPLWLLGAILLVVGFGYDAARVKKLPAGPRPLSREEPPPDTKAGHGVTWEGWTFRWAVRRREGLILTDVAFQGRSVLKYAGLAEIFVPYNRGQPRPEDSREGMGNTLVALIPGKDCVPGAASCRLFDAEGKQDGKRVVMMHEESAGLVYMGKQGRAYGKMLVLWCMSRLGGYTYITSWRFRDDGCLMPQMGLTGELEHTGRGDSSPLGSFVGKNADGHKVFAPSHVHNFYFCLDFDIDGPEDNVVEEFNYRQDRPGSLTAKHSWTPILQETSRPWDGNSFRSWRVINRASKNAWGHPRSYELIPGGNGTFRGASSEPFTHADLWVTRYDAKKFPCSAADPRSLRTALPTYLNGESVDGADVVIWYVLHVHHVPRTEDYPAMPIDWVGFLLKPRDFLDASPLSPK